MRTMRSMRSNGAIPSCRRRSASRPNGRLQRLTRKPGPSAARMTSLPIASPVARARASAVSPDSSPATSSSSRISGAGLKKCIPTTRSGCLAPAATAVTSREEVLVASTQSSATISLSRPSSSSFSSSDSGAASITSSHSRRSSSAGAASSSPAPRSASSALQRPRSAPRARCPRAASSPCSSACSTGSCTRVRVPASAPSCAIPAPIVPAPTTPMTPRGGHGKSYAGTIALIPVAARPMMSFWICEVPS